MENFDAPIWRQSVNGPWCRAPMAVQSCASLMLYPCVATAFLGIMPASGVWEQQAPVATTRTDWTDLQSAMALQPFILHPSKIAFSTNTYKRALGGLGCFRPFLGLQFVPPRAEVVGWGRSTPCWPPQHRARELRW